MLHRAFARYHDHIFNPKRPHSQCKRSPEIIPVPAKNAAGRASGQLAQLLVKIDSTNETLFLGVDESYSLQIGYSNQTAILSASTVYGAIRGLETFSQLTIRTVGDTSAVVINSTKVTISDAPRFPWRGIMMDTARHWHPLSSLYTMIDALAFNRMNTFHWHITDAQSFPLKTKAFPKLAEGAYGGANTTMVYDAADVAQIIAYAKDRGVRVVPEIDSPGHSASWQIGYNSIGVHDGDINANEGLLDPTNEESYTLLSGLFGELAEMFEDEYIHIGCDEVNFRALNESDSVVQYMAAHRIPRTNRGFKQLIATYIERLSKIVIGHGKTPVAWQEAMDHYGDSEANPTPPAAGLPEQLVVEQWLSPVWNWANLSAITGDSYASTTDLWPKGHQGFRALVTDGWYLDSSGGGPDVWKAPYAKEPLTNKSCTYSEAFPQGNCSCTCPEHPWRDGKCHCFDLRFDEVHSAKVLGGEACLWGERTDAAIVQQRAFPGACAVAERLWSAMELQDPEKAAPRLTRQRCRMLERGVDVTPAQPGYCV
jgi:hexosaminidase